MEFDFDIIIIGSGPAGLTSGIYSARGGMKTLILEKGVFGGQVATSNEIENYPGSSKENNASQLVERMKEQAESFGVQLLNEEFKNFIPCGNSFTVITSAKEYLTKAVIVATGAQPKLLGCKGESEFRGLGVSYCATCDGAFFRNRDVIVVGGGDTALEEAYFLTRFVNKVYILYRRNVLRAAKILQDRVKNNEKIILLPETILSEIKGNGIVESVTLKNIKTENTYEMAIDGVFIFVGQAPNTKEFEGMLDMDSNHYIIADNDMKTSVKGVFVAGDVRQKNLRQIVTATSDGAIAAISAIKYIEECEV